jgi:hypothetical protein
MYLLRQETKGSSIPVRENLQLLLAKNSKFKYGAILPSLGFNANPEQWEVVVRP